MTHRRRRLTPEASIRHWFGAEMRSWRQRRGLSQRELAKLIWHSEETVAKVEKAERWPSRDLARRCDEILDTGGVLLAAWPAVQRQRLASDGRRQRYRSRRPSNGA